MPEIVDLEDTWSIINAVFGGIESPLTKHQYIDIWQSNGLNIGENRLWLAILASIVEDWLEHRDNPTSKTAKNVAEIKSWIYQDCFTMECLGTAIYLLLKIPYEDFKKRLYNWLAKYEPMGDRKAFVFDVDDPLREVVIESKPILDLTIVPEDGYIIVRPSKGESFEELIETVNRSLDVRFTATVNYDEKKIIVERIRLT